jgi:hypothetical protein
VKHIRRRWQVRTRVDPCQDAGSIVVGFQEHVSNVLHRRSRARTLSSSEGIHRYVDYVELAGRYSPQRATVIALSACRFSHGASCSA